MTTEAAGSGSPTGGFLHPSKVIVEKDGPGTIGLWGGYDFSKSPLELSLSPSGIINWTASPFSYPADRIIHMMGLNVGTTTLSAREQFNTDRVWCYIQVEVVPTAGDPVGGRKYTEHPNERVTRRTTPMVADVVTLLSTQWPELTEAGVRTLTAQSMYETGEWMHCYNWNLGNVKAPLPSVPHMYLAHNLECKPQAEAERLVQDGHGQVHIATPEEITQRRWQGRCDGTSYVVFEPPHAFARFRAYGTLLEGAQRWIAHHQGIAHTYPDYVNEVNTGDTTAVAHTMSQAGYYNGSETAYSAGMARYKKLIDNLLGP